MHDKTLPIYEAINPNEPEWGSPVLHRGLEVRWEVLRFEMTVRTVCIWLEFFLPSQTSRQFLGQCQKVTPAERLNIKKKWWYIIYRLAGWAFFVHEVDLSFRAFLFSGQKRNQKTPRRLCTVYLLRIPIHGLADS